MRFLIDMNLSPKWVQFLTQAGHQATHWSEVGPGDAPDQELLDYAAANQLVIMTHDLDFGTLLAIGGLSTPSVIQFRTQRILPHQAGEQLLAAVQTSQPDLDKGALVTIEPAKHRLTVLPINH